MFGHDCAEGVKGLKGFSLNFPFKSVYELGRSSAAALDVWERGKNKGRIEEKRGTLATLVQEAGGGRKAGAGKRRKEERKGEKKTE